MSARVTWIALGLLGACASSEVSPREATVASAMTRADHALIDARPVLVAGKYARMTEDVIGYYRGSVPVFAHDFKEAGGPLSRSRFALDAPLVLGTGDPHLENFGVLAAADGTLGLEPNDFDTADYYPYLFELRRMLASLVVAAHGANSDDPSARQATVDRRREIARTAAVAYASSMKAYAEGAARQPVVDAGTSTILADLWKRGKRDLAARQELADVTVLSGGVRTLKRGVLDPASPLNTYADLPASPRAALPEVLAEYRRSLVAPPAPEFFTVLDSVREFGSGVASWPRVRAIVLVRGPRDDPADDMLLEVKEEADPPSAGWTPPGVHFDTIQSRVTSVARRIWARPDAAPLWGASTWMGLPVQVRAELTGQKTLRVSRLVGDRGTPEALASLGQVLGSLLARVHATPSPVSSQPAVSIWARLASDPAYFADEQADAALAYGDQAAADAAGFSHSLSVLGPLLGSVVEASDSPPPDLAALYGAPPL